MHISQAIKMLYFLYGITTAISLLKLNFSCVFVLDVYQSEREITELCAQWFSRQWPRFKDSPRPLLNH